MRRTRWKLAAGVLGLSLGGLAAVADVPARTGMLSCAPVAQAPAPPTLPQLPPAPLPVPAALPAPAVVTPADLPAVPMPMPQPMPVITASAVETAPLPRAAAQVFELAVPAAPAAAAPVIPAAAPAPVLPTPTLNPAPQAPATPAAPVVDATPQFRPDPAPQASQPAPAELAPQAAEKKLKVMLHMGDDRPRFEVRDGNEVYLKVVCDKVDVKSPSDRGENMSTMRAAGKVTFVTPGGEGTCDELSVVPGTGQVIVNGKVAFTYNWGKVETTVSGDRMTFRLGAAPGVALPATPTAVPASYQRTR